MQRNINIEFCRLNWQYAKVSLPQLGLNARDLNVWDDGRGWFEVRINGQIAWSGSADNKWDARCKTVYCLLDQKHEHLP